MAKKKRGGLGKWILLAAMAVAVTCGIAASWNGIHQPAVHVEKNQRQAEPVFPEVRLPPLPHQPKPVPAPADDNAAFAPEYPATGESASPATPPSSDTTSVPNPRIAIVIDDMGVNLAGSARAITLPASVTLSFLPYAPRVADQARKASANGHELLLHMPMEPVGRENTGPDPLLVSLPAKAIRERIETAIAKVPGAIGVNNHMGSRFTTSAAGMAIVANTLKKHGMFFLDSRTIASSVGEATARSHGLPTASRDVFLDDPAVAHDVPGQLAKAEQTARRNGHAIVIGHPHSVTIEALEKWIPEATSRGFEIVPVSTLMRTSPPAAAFKASCCGN